MEQSGEFENVKYFPNSAIYGMKGEKRYLTERFDHKKKKTEFYINSFEPNRLLNRLLNYCRGGKTRAELISYLCDFVDDPADAKSYLCDLINEGLLITELYPNMTGDKYFDRLVAIASEHHGDSGLAHEVQQLENLLTRMLPEDDLALDGINGSELYTRARKNFKSVFYVGYQKNSSSALDKKHQDSIRDGLACLAKIAPETTQKSLDKFMTRFRARFEDQEVPLLLALDREAGIGYEGLEANLVTSELLDGIQLDLQLSTLSFSWTPVHELFLSKLVAVNDRGAIVISEADLE